MSEEKICKNCGKQISEDFKLCPYCGEKVEEEILEILCPYCGKTIKSDFKVCPYCGNNPNSKKENYLEETNLNTNQSDDPLICKFCGKPKKSEFQICPHCGNNSNLKKENYNNYDTENRENYYSNNSNNHRENYDDYNYHNNYNTKNRTNYYSSNYEVSPKSGVVCLILLIFLPSFHRFYAGKIGSGIIMLLLDITFIIFVGVLSELSYYNEVGTILAGLIVFITAIISLIWWIIDLVSILRGKFKDSQGRCIKLKN